MQARSPDEHIFGSSPPLSWWYRTPAGPVEHGGSIQDALQLCHEVFCEKDGAIVWLVANGMIVERFKHPELAWIDACRVRITKYGHEFVSKDVYVEKGGIQWIYGRLSDHCTQI